MDFLKSQLDRIQQQLGGLTATQKMLTAALVAVMVLTLLYWGKYAGQAEMEPLLSQALADEDLTRITRQLDGLGVEHQVSPDKKILVAADRRMKILSSLGFADALPKNTANGFDEIIKQMTPWDGQSRQDAMFNRGKEMTLAEVIRGFPDVADATVAIDPTKQRNISTGNVEPTAFVSIKMKSGGKPNKQLVAAAANVVAGAQAGLALKNIKVVVDGSPQHVVDPTDDTSLAEGIDDIRQRTEARFTQKVAGQLRYIPGVLVAVTVDVNSSTRVVKQRKIDGVMQKEQRTQSDGKESTGSTPSAPVDPGATANLSQSGSNTGATLAGGAGGVESSQTENTEKTDFALFPSWTETDLRTPAGEAVPVVASVRVPWSHFVRIAKGRGTAEPDDAAVQKKLEEELPRIKSTVMHCMRFKSTDDVAVDPYYDDAPAAPETVPAAAATVLPFGALGGHMKEILLGGLAVVSLFVVSTIVRKGAPAVAVARPAAEPAATTPVLVGGEAIVGEAADGNPLLSGLELDDDAVRTEQVREQVSTLVTENPDAAAALVKRWLNRS